MSRKGNCYDNALAESFWATVKTECFDNFRDGIPKTWAQALRALFHTIELFANRERLHSALGYNLPFSLNKLGHNETSHRYSPHIQGKTRRVETLWEVGLESLIPLTKRKTMLHPTPQLTIEHSGERIAIFRAGASHPCLVQNSVNGKRPFIHPLVAPDGEGELTENEPSHHPWQHGLYTGLNDVNGVGFWTENLTGNPKDGSFSPLPLTAPQVSAAAVAWEVVTQWKAPDQRLLLTETQIWKFGARGATFALDLQWQLCAATDLRFGSSSYGGLFLRMPWRAVTRGKVLNSEGDSSQAAAEGRRARWLALAMPLPQREHGVAGMAMLDHPSNPEHPSPWRVDDNLGIAPSRSIAGEWFLKTNEVATNRYRLLGFCGSIEPSTVEGQWKQFAQN